MLHSDCLYSYVYERHGLIEKMMGIEFGMIERVKHNALMYSTVVWMLDTFSNNVAWLV